MKLSADFTFEKYGLSLRFVNEGDAEFIIKLRTDPKLGRFIHPTSPDVELQKKWIREYKDFESNEPFEYAIASALIVRTIAFDILDKKLEFGVEGCHIDNKKVIKFNLMIGLKIKGKRIEEGEEFYTFNLTKADFELRKPKIERLIGY